MQLEKKNRNASVIYSKNYYWFYINIYLIVTSLYINDYDTR